MRFDVDILSKPCRDSIANIVIERLRRAIDIKHSCPVHQGLSFESLALRADAQYRRTYLREDARRVQQNFGFCPKRYYGLTQIKTNATRFWKRDLVITNFDSMFTTSPTPEPTLDKASKARVKEAVERELAKRMQEAGVLDPQVLAQLDANGNLDYRVQDFLRQQVKALQRLERNRLIDLSTQAAEVAKTRLTDILIEGNFRQMYGTFTHEQVLYGVGFVKFPEFRRIQTIKHSGKGAKPDFVIKPFFRNPSVFNMFPVGDGASLSEMTAVLEVTSISRIDLINLYHQDGYNKNEIEQVLIDFENADRNWLGIEGFDNFNPVRPYWGPDDKIPMIIHEGFLSGSDLNDIGITGLDATEYANVEVVVVGGRTIRCKIMKAPNGSQRSYYAVPFNRFGTDFWDVLGMGAMLWDTELRINCMMHAFEHNLDWASRPPMLVDPEQVDPDDGIQSVQPGRLVGINPDVTGLRNAEVLKPIQVVSAQYQLIYNTINQLMRGADEECGIPAFAYGAQDFGRSSLGEYAQRMSNALRTVKDAALEEDVHFIQPAFQAEFQRLMLEDKDGSLSTGQDIDLQVRGLTGLLLQDTKAKDEKAILGSLVNLGSQGLVPPEAVKYGVTQFLKSAGFPIESLGMTDPDLDLAVADATANSMSAGQAAAQRQAGSNMATTQVPPLDGRSAGVPVAAVASPSGESQKAF